MRAEDDEDDEDDEDNENDEDEDDEDDEEVRDTLQNRLCCSPNNPWLTSLLPSTSLQKRERKSARHRTPPRLPP